MNTENNIITAILESQKNNSIVRVEVQSIDETLKTLESYWLGGEFDYKDDCVNGEEGVDAFGWAGTTPETFQDFRLFLVEKN